MAKHDTRYRYYSQRTTLALTAAKYIIDTVANALLNTPSCSISVWVQNNQTFVIRKTIEAHNELMDVKEDLHAFYVEISQSNDNYPLLIACRELLDQLKAMDESLIEELRTLYELTDGEFNNADVDRVLQKATA